MRIHNCRFDFLEGDIGDHFRYTLSNRGTLRWVGFKQQGGEHDADAQDKLLDMYVDLVCKIGANRTWSYMQQEVPPFKYVPALSSDARVAAEALQEMRFDWETLLALEQEALINDAVQELLDDMIWPCKKAVRLLYSLYERDQWSPASVAGQRYRGQIKLCLDFWPWGPGPGSRALPLSDGSPWVPRGPGPRPGPSAPGLGLRALGPGPGPGATGPGPGAPRPQMERALKVSEGNVPDAS